MVSSRIRVMFSIFFLLSRPDRKLSSTSSRVYPLLHKLQQAGFPEALPVDLVLIIENGHGKDVPEDEVERLHRQWKGHFLLDQPDRVLRVTTKGRVRTVRLGERPFDTGYAILDPSTPERVAKDARRKRKRGMVQLCTTVDAWAPEARALDLGRRCLEALLRERGWTVRILTKSAAVRQDFDLIEKHRDRVLVGLSITGTAYSEDVLKVLEPNAPPISDRMSVLAEAAARGLRTYAMFCPLLPAVADSTGQIDCLIKSSVACGAEEVFAEPVNPRGPGLRLCQEALERAGHAIEADAVGNIRRRKHWSRYAAMLLLRLQGSMRDTLDIGKLRFLLYPSGLLPEDRTRIREDDAGVVWLGRA